MKKSRTIKFRAWDEDDKEMTYFDRSTSNWSYATDCLWFEDLITQFTGLQDKNRKDIYEGDIIRCFKTYYSTPIEHLGQVVFEKGAFLVGSDTMPDYYMTFIELDSDWGIEIVGNIYENPELLE